MSVPSTVASETGKAVVETGQVFAKGGTDGLILYAMILGTFLMFLGLVFTQWVNYRDRKAEREQRREADSDQADASRLTAEALKDVASAVASSTSADLAFKQALAGTLDRSTAMLDRLERKSAR